MDVISGSLWFNADAYTSLIKKMSTKQLLEEEKKITAAIDRRTLRKDVYNGLSFLTVGASKIGSSIAVGRINIARQKLEIIQVEIKRRGLAEHGQRAEEDIQTSAEPFQTAAEHIHTTNGPAETVAEHFVSVNYSKSDKTSWTAGTQHESQTKGIKSVEEQQSEGINIVEEPHGEELNYTEEKQEEDVEEGGRRGRVKKVVKGTAKLLASAMGDALLQPVAEGVINALLGVGKVVISG
eukprot:TRINITY_DN2921_c0_g1_i4.p1 TRINITY_DN2921_c0_g1~~TRINITY_DN2921_c0_g1_i4.p1  ORF type:complete len:238 (-),score=40.61 TRINITY_DN2921_c0_g1_i4:241-954(-)